MRQLGLTWQDLPPMPPGRKCSAQVTAVRPAPVKAAPAPEEEAERPLESALMEAVRDMEPCPAPDPAPSPEPPVLQAAPTPAPVLTPATAPIQPTPQGVKFDDGKLRLDLLPPAAIRALGEVLTYGAAKYGDRNWEQGIAPERLYAALQRHLLAWREGNLVDCESGITHLSHALCYAAMLVAQERRHG